jgi:uncharacterized protein with PIN domain
LAVEARMAVHGRRGQRAVMLMDDLLRLPGFELAAAGIAEMDAAGAAFVLFVKGSGHNAELNCGGVSSYALAKVRGRRFYIRAMTLPRRISSARATRRRDDPNPRAGCGNPRDHR